jgi:carbonic anhydrase
VHRLIKIDSKDKIPSEYLNTPVGFLLRYHNLNEQFTEYSNAQLLVGMCIDNRKHLKIPDNFAFIIRAGGANLRYSEFKVSYAIGVGGVKHLALIGHNHCGMVNLISRRKLFVEGIVNNAGWTKEQAENYFDSTFSKYEIFDEIDFIRSEVKWLRQKYPKVQVAPMFYLVEDKMLYLINEKEFSSNR